MGRGFDPELVKANALLKLFGFFKIPMVFFIGPTVAEASDEKVVIKIKYRKRVTNHLGSIYFAVLMAGADLAGGFAAVEWIRRKNEKVAIIFKDVSAKFLKRSQSDVYFTFADVQAVRDFIDDVIATGERKEMPLNIVATTPDTEGDEPVATFQLTLSAKKKS